MNKTKSILMEYFDIDEIEVTNRFKRETLCTSQELSTQLLFEKFILGSIQDYFKKRLNQGCPTRGPLDKLVRPFLLLPGFTPFLRGAG